MARLAGVSRATVSAVVNRNKFVTEATRDRVLSAIASLDYRPDAIARSLKISRTNTIGFLLPSIESPFWPPVARAAEHHLREHAYRLFMANTDEDNGVADRAMEMFLETRLDGAIAAPPAGVRRRPYELYVGSGRPLVFIERAVPWSAIETRQDWAAGRVGGPSVASARRAADGTKRRQSTNPTSAGCGGCA